MLSTAVMDHFVGTNLLLLFVPSKPAESNFIIAEEQLALPYFKAEPSIVEKLPSLNLNEIGNLISVENKNFKVTFDKEKGIIQNYDMNGKQFFDKGPEPNFWRAPTDNDFGNGMQKRCAIWEFAGKNRIVKE